MSISRKVRREMQMQARKAFRSAIKEEAMLVEYQKRFRDGFDVGYKQAIKELTESISTRKEEDSDPTLRVQR